MHAATYAIGLLIILCHAIISVKGNRIITTPLGLIQGISVRTSTGKEADAFLGIPYAEPPIGPKRFLPPKAKDPWNDTFIANAFTNSCTQIDLRNKNGGKTPWWVPIYNMSEDCLHLNIWVPQNLSEKTAVMVWIHGGGFGIGASNIEKFNGAILATEENVIVVTINYRLSVFGFLHLNDTDVKGNMGLLDQVQALKWIQQNIESFGGDKDRVTLFGVSAGGISGALHLVSSEPQLLHAVIIQSGTPETLDVLNSFQPENPIKRKRLTDIVEKFNCSDISNKQAIIDCLREIEANELLTEVPFMDFSFLRPIADGKFLEKDYEILRNEKHFQNISVMLGDTAQDGSVFASFYNPEVCSASGNCHLNRSEFLLMVKRLVPGVGDFVHKAIDFSYTDWYNPNDVVKNRDEAMKMYTDLITTCPTTKLAKSLVEAERTVYQYQFNHTPSVSETPVDWIAAFHGSDVDFIFGTPLNSSYGFNEQEVTLSKNMMRYWANFAKYKNPNGGDPSGTRELPYWPTYTMHEKDYMDLSTNISNAKGLRVRQCAFWDVAFPELIDVDQMLKKKENCV